jgi:hypothetical protein
MFIRSVARGARRSFSTVAAAAALSVTAAAKADAARARTVRAPFVGVNMTEEDGRPWVCSAERVAF